MKEIMPLLEELIVSCKGYIEPEKVIKCYIDILKLINKNGKNRI